MAPTPTNSTASHAFSDRFPAGFPDPALAPTADSLLALIGGTPLVRLTEVTRDVPAQIFVKLEQTNPGGSSKDRIALHIVREAERAGELKPGARIIDNGAGNTAIGFAVVGARTGHPVTLVASTELSPVKERLLALHGAEILRGRPDLPFSDPRNWEAIAARHADEDPATWWSHQSATPTNPGAHYLSTGPEIWAQTAGRVTHFLAATATGGTVSGTGRYLKERNPRIKVITTDFVEGPNSSNGLDAAIASGAPIPEDQRTWPTNIDTELLDALELRPRHDVIEFGWRLAREEGLALGLTSVLSILVALDLAQDTTAEDTFVVFSADSARDYLDHEYNAEWLRAHDLADIADEFSG